MKHKDNRIKVINEILAGIKARHTKCEPDYTIVCSFIVVEQHSAMCTFSQVLKMYAWEKSFSDIVNGLRTAELRCVKIQAYFNAGIGLAWFNSKYLVRETLHIRTGSLLSTLKSNTSTLLML